MRTRSGSGSCPCWSRSPGRSERAAGRATRRSCSACSSGSPCPSSRTPQSRPRTSRRSSRSASRSGISSTSAPSSSPSRRAGSRRGGSGSSRGRSRRPRTAYLIATTPYHAYEHLYSDAFGLAILEWLNRTWYFTNTDLKRLLLGILVLTVVAGLASDLLRRAVGSAAASDSRQSPSAARVAALVVAWNLTGEIAAADASNSIATTFRSTLPTPPDWIDQATGREADDVHRQVAAGLECVLVDRVLEPVDRRRLVGRRERPAARSRASPRTSRTWTARSSPQIPVDFAVATPGVDMVGKVAEMAGGLTLYRLSKPIRIRDSVIGITPDGWMSTSARLHALREAERTSWSGGGHAEPGGGLRQRAGLAHRRSACRSCASTRTANRPPAGCSPSGARTLRSTPCDSLAVRIPVRPPFRVDVSADRTFQPSQYDPRQLSAQVGFGFEPAKR